MKKKLVFDGGPFTGKSIDVSDLPIDWGADPEQTFDLPSPDGSVAHYWLSRSTYLQDREIHDFAFGGFREKKSTVSLDKKVETRHCYYCAEPFQWSYCPCGTPIEEQSPPTSCPRCHAMRLIVMECLRETNRVLSSS